MSQTHLKTHVSSIVTVGKITWAPINLQTRNPTKAKVFPYDKPKAISCSFTEVSEVTSTPYPYHREYHQKS